MGTNTSDARDAARARDIQAVLDAVRRIVHALRESSRWAERHLGLSGAQLFVLQKLAEVPGASVNELAARTHTHQSSVSTVVARLVERGLVRRARAEADGRRLELSLSANGRRMVDGAPDVAQERLIQGVTHLPAVRRRQLARTLDDLARAMGAASATDTHIAPAMFFEDRRRKETRRKDARRA